MSLLNQNASEVEIRDLMTLRDTVERFKYKENHKVFADPSSAGATLWFFMPVTCVRTGKQDSLQMNRPIILPTTLSFLKRVIAESWLDMEKHEMYEWLKFDTGYIVDPHPELRK